MVFNQGSWKEGGLHAQKEEGEKQKTLGGGGGGGGGACWEGRERVLCYQGSEQELKKNLIIKTRGKILN